MLRKSDKITHCLLNAVILHPLVNTPLPPSFSLKRRRILMLGQESFSSSLSILQSGKGPQLVLTSPSLAKLRSHIMMPCLGSLLGILTSFAISPASLILTDRKSACGVDLLCLEGLGWISDWSPTVPRCIYLAFEMNSTSFFPPAHCTCWAGGMFLRHLVPGRVTALLFLDGATMCSLALDASASVAGSNTCHLRDRCR